MQNHRTDDKKRNKTRSQKPEEAPFCRPRHSPCFKQEKKREKRRLPQDHSQRTRTQLSVAVHATEDCYTMAGTSSSQESKKRKRVVKAADNKGQLTPTQLRNARKRRAKQQSKESNPAGKSSRKEITSDPSSLYGSNPRKAPLVEAARQFFQNKVNAFPIHLGPTCGWRTVAKLAVRSSGGSLTIGMFAPGSHRLVAVPDCPAHHPSINKAVTVVQSSARKLKVQAFDETNGEGYFRHIAFSVERSTGAVQITIVWNGQDDSGVANEEKKKKLGQGQSLLDRFCSSLIEKGRDKGNDFLLHSLWVHYNSSWKHANAIFSIEAGRWEHVYGPEHGTVEFLEGFPMSIPLYFPPTVFRQANLDAFGTIVAEIRSYLSGIVSQSKRKNRCVELYGGVGTIGLHVSDLCKSLVCSDENPHNTVCFNKSLGSLSSKDRTAIRYDPFCATKMVDSLREADWVIVDPPRKGLDDQVLNALCSRDQCPSTKVLVYVSCGFDAFQRDYKVLTNKGDWKLQRAAGYILFPGSNAIETLAIFSR